MTHTTNLGMKTNVGQVLIFEILASTSIEPFFKKITWYYYWDFLIYKFHINVVLVFSFYLKSCSPSFGIKVQG
jgi:hypothetical protein